MSLRRRTTLAAMASVFIAIVVFGSALSWLVRRNAPIDQADRLVAYVEESIAEIETNDAASLDPGGGIFYIISAEGEILATNGPYDHLWFWADDDVLGNGPSDLPDGYSVGYVVNPELDEQDPSLDPLEFDPNPYRAVEAHLVLPTNEPGTFVALEPVSAIDEQIEGLQAITLVAAVFAAVTAGIAAWYSTGRALKPLADIVGAADLIDEHAPELLPEPTRNDEIGSLTNSLNRMVNRLGKARAQLAESAAQQEQFVADASHELRSPLTTIRSNAEFLLTKPDAGSDDRSAAAADIVAESERMGTLVNDLLTLAKADEGDLIRSEPVDLTGLVAGLAFTLNSERRPVKIDAEPGVFVNGDPDALERMLRILVDNSTRYGAGTITLQLTGDVNSAVLSVTDEGPGFRPEALDRVFDRFYRDNAARSPEGTGLGLAIAKATAEAHDGSIHALNAESGARVVVTLPRVSSSSHLSPTSD